MAILSTDFILRDIQSYRGQTIMNVFYYRADNAATATAEELCNAYLADVIPELVALQVDQLVHNQIYAENLVDPGDFFALGISEAGVGGSSDGMPSFVAAKFFYQRSTRNGRSGAKRFAGFSELSFNADGFPNPGAPTTAVAALVEALAGNLVGDPTVYQPMLPHSLRHEPDPPAHTEVWYTLDSLFPFSGIVYNGWGTQNSRKLRRGI